ncbi:hypothetical protein O2W15_11660 [Modestobacter sp. VKM Ac-2979]|uniref:hypothetical protein n=1 Tax=unclassified Modestobacter TaxID=2643866 RepID=UPI0022ABB969|nr:MULTISPECIES: hypothetical protein [unclassified Modestobacter]MCZ2812091.1 hypothetical protein [Modestobacter sp. VKM Ac-2979]MCZ2843815.1 hypothetical protein [Modestobacter sp. VKM Ac-2980]
MTGLIRHAPPLAVRVRAEAAVAGQPLTVLVEVIADGPAEVAGGVVELVRSTAVTHAQRTWSGAGHRVGIRDSAVLSHATLDIAGALAAGGRAVRQVTLFVPAEQVTITGYLVQQEYLVRAQVRAQEGRPVEGEVRIRVAGPASQLHRRTEVAPVERGDEFASLAIDELSAPRVCAGVPLSGVVAVAPHRAGTTRGVRVELVLAELTRARPGELLEEDCEATTVVSAVPASGPAQLAPGQALRLPFALPVPDPLPAPSLSTPEFTLRWLVRVVLDRALREDSSTSVELPAG